VKPSQCQDLGSALESTHIRSARNKQPHIINKMTKLVLSNVLVLKDHLILLARMFSEGHVDVRARVGIVFLRTVIGSH